MGAEATAEVLSTFLRPAVLMADDPEVSEVFISKIGDHSAKRMNDRRILFIEIISDRNKHLLHASADNAYPEVSAAYGSLPEKALYCDNP